MANREDAAGVQGGGVWNDGGENDRNFFLVLARYGRHDWAFRILTDPD